MKAILRSLVMFKQKRLQVLNVLFAVIKVVANITDNSHVKFFYRSDDDVEIVCQLIVTCPLPPPLRVTHIDLVTPPAPVIDLATPQPLLVHFVSPEEQEQRGKVDDHDDDTMLDCEG
ncbi:uncharacterized protein LOC131665447 isoform X2 [Phymastichus coffea]|uniref:uncharacterized protein LOC131665447 isoform X2 n=1 Tax=Phymastichus coffea TaxID=108790 RepID=UPI00273C9E3F|nr:uncharacterized protein LOC131665447 isoform X2 [Phymastichus coffea]